MARQVEYSTSVDVAWTQVSRVLDEDTRSMLQEATDEAAEEASSLFTKLSADVGGIDMSIEAEVSVGQPEYDEDELVLRIPIGWHARRWAPLFPEMGGVLEARAEPDADSGTTTLHFVGEYEPPLGPVGEVVDSAAGHLVADESVRRFVDRVAARLEDRTS